jgi:preprotein translocase subunit Sec63
MVKIGILLQEGKVSRINELELERYVNFFRNSSQDNLKHCHAVLESFPRWSIISGYYAMHDFTKLFLATQFRLKVEFEVHATTIKVLEEVLKNEELLGLIQKGYQEFISLANDLAVAKGERVKSQYYTGTKYLAHKYQKRAKAFLLEVVEPFLFKMKQLVGGEK